MTQIYTYLNFKGNCRDAMTFYKECLGGELSMQSVGETPMAEQMPEHMHSHIMHSTLSKDGFVIMASDMNRGSLVEGNAMHMCVNCSSEDEINSFFSNLSEGGEISDPLTDTFWGAKYGALTDKYGKKWMFNYDKQQKA